MDKKKLDFIVKHFGCKTTINGEDVLTSLGNASTVSTNDFHGYDTERGYFYTKTGIEIDQHLVDFIEVIG